MRQIIALMLLTVMVLAGCASDRAYEAYGSAYAAYAGRDATQSKSCEIITKNAVTLPEGFNLVCYQASSSANLVPPQQIKDSEWTAPVQGLISAAGTVGSIYAVGAMVKDVAKSVGKNAGHNTTGSNNPVDNSNQGNPIDNSLHDNPIDNSNQGNPVTPAPVVVPPVVITPVITPGVTQ